MKKKGNRSVIGCLAAVCMLLPVMSCVYHDPDEDWNKNGKVRLMLNWKEKKRPVAMDYYFYQDGAAVRSSAVVKLAVMRGRFRRATIGWLCVTPMVPMSNYRWKAATNPACAVARPASVLKAVSSGVEQPHGLYGTGGELLSVSGKTDRIAELYPVSLVRELELNIRVVGLSEVERLTGSLSGYSPGGA